jgi:hypothetical protein
VVQAFSLHLAEQTESLHHNLPLTEFFLKDFNALAQLS